MTIASGAVTIATGGVAAPLLIGALLRTGFGVGLTGGGLKLGGVIHERKNKVI